MQQIFLTGKQAGDMAIRLLTALNLRPVGYRLLPFAVDGEEKGQMLHLLMPPAEGVRNDVPCIIETGAQPIVLPGVFDLLAAPALRQAMHARTPILLGGVPLLALAAPAFREAMMNCLAGDMQVITVVLPDAVEAVRMMGGEQLWIDLDAPDADAQMMLLQSELADIL